VMGGGMDAGAMGMGGAGGGGGWAGEAGGGEVKGGRGGGAAGAKRKVVAAPQGPAGLFTEVCCCMSICGYECG